MGFETSHWCFLTVQMETHESNLRTEASSRDCRELGEWTPAFAFWGGQVQGWGVLAEGSRGEVEPAALYGLPVLWNNSLLDLKVFNILKSPLTPTKFTVPISINCKPRLDAPFTVKLVGFFQKRKFDNNFSVNVVLSQESLKFSSQNTARVLQKLKKW